MTTVLLIDDDEALAPPLAAYLQRFGYRLEAVQLPSQGLARLARGGVDAVILDVMLPEMDGFETLRQIRRTSAVPVLMLTARGELSDRVVGLETGADDYLAKPFEPRELAARLQTVLRRARAAPAGPAWRFDRLEIDTDRREVRRDAELLALTGTEYELLCLLAREPGKVLSRDEILNRLRGSDAELHSRAVDILVSRLRRKLEPLDAIKTLRNAGYALALPLRP